MTVGCAPSATKLICPRWKAVIFPSLSTMCTYLTFCSGLLHHKTRTTLIKTTTTMLFSLGLAPKSAKLRSSFLTIWSICPLWTTFASWDCHPQRPTPSYGWRHYQWRGGWLRPVCWWFVLVIVAGVACWWFVLALWQDHGAAAVRAAAWWWWEQRTRVAGVILKIEKMKVVIIR